MDRTERIALLHGLFTRHRYGLDNERLMQHAQCSRATLYRDLGFMRDVLGAPLEHEGDPKRIWRYVNRDAAFRLPGVWLSADEVHVLMLAQQVIQGGDGGLLGQALGPLQPRIHKLLGDKARRLDRLRVLRTQARRTSPSVFRLVTEAVLDARQLRFTYQSRSTGQDRERQVSPQRLTHHRDNWYLDAYDPTQDSLRRYALDRIRRPQLTDDTAIDIPPARARRPPGSRLRHLRRPHRRHCRHPLHPACRPLGSRRSLAPPPTPAPATRRHPGTRRPLRQSPRAADGRATLRRRRRSHRPARVARADAGDAGEGVREVWVGLATVED